MTDVATENYIVFIGVTKQLIIGGVHLVYTGFYHLCKCLVYKL
jgi:hypothetical protein